MKKLYLGFGSFVCLLSFLWDYLVTTKNFGFGTFQFLLLFTGILFVSLSFFVSSRILVNLTLSLLVFLSMPVFAEVFLFAYNQLNSHGVSQDMVLNDSYIYELSPSHTFKFQGNDGVKDYEVVYRSNSQGFRGPELISDRDTFRIMLYGDSFIQAEYSEEENTFARQLENKLRKNCRKDVEVVNAGVKGYGPDQVLRKLREDLPEYKPDLVILSIYLGNDYGDLIRNKLYKIDERGKIHAQNTTLFEVDPLRFGVNLYRLLGKALKRLRPDSLGGTVKIKNILWVIEAQYDQYLKSGKYNKDVIEQDPSIYNSDVPDVDLLVGYKTSSVKKALMRYVLEEIDKLTLKKQTKLVSLLIPSPYFYPDSSFKFSDVENYKENFRPFSLSDITAEFLNNYKIAFFDLYTAFQSFNIDSLFFTAHNHWNDYGQEKAAQLVGDEILRGKTEFAKSFSCELQD